MQTNQRSLAVMDKQVLALKLRREGRTYDEIARELGYASKSGAYRAVSSAMMRTLRAPADELRQLEAIRLDALQSGIWEDAMSGNVKAVDAVLKIIARRVKLFALDRDPKEFIRPEEFRAAAHELLAIIARHVPPERLPALRKDIERLVRGTTRGRG